MATAAAANESRSDLLNWLNDLLQLSITKIESLGTGAVLCQVMDSIYGDVQMHKVKFGNIQPYECINNFKVLQACFTNHGLDKTIPVERLIKMKFQDNLEFLQWMKKFWDSNFPGGRYDAVGRRKGNSMETTAPNVGLKKAPVITRGSAMSATQMASSTMPITNSSSTSPSSSSLAAMHSSNANGSLNQLQQQMAQSNRKIQELEASIDEIEKERDFYFNKLREIEIATQQSNDQATLQSPLFKIITEILYKTEEGFEIPDVEPHPPTTEPSSVATTRTTSLAH